MSTADDDGHGGGEHSPRADALKKAEHELHDAERKLEHGETGEAKAEIQKALADIEKAEHSPIEVKVNGIVKLVLPGTYVVAAFKSLVDVPADRELDVVHHGMFEPLNDNAEITIHECETFVSHVRTGSSS